MVLGLPALPASSLESRLSERLLWGTKARLGVPLLRLPGKGNSCTLWPPRCCWLDEAVLKVHAGLSLVPRRRGHRVLEGSVPSPLLSSWDPI